MFGSTDWPANQRALNVLCHRPNQCRPLNDLLFACRKAINATQIGVDTLDQIMGATSCGGSVIQVGQSQQPYFAGPIGGGSPVLPTCVRTPSVAIFSAS